MTEIPGSLIRTPSYGDVPSVVSGLVFGLAISVALWVLIALAVLMVA
jgi:hypothetical protein